MRRADEAYEFVKAKILAYEWLPGQPLKEIDLSRQLNMSRTPIRRAFVSLEEEGYITSSDNKGVVVAERQLTKKEFKDCVDFFELMTLNYLQKLQSKEYDYPADKLEAPLEEMKTAYKEEGDFVYAESQFWRVFLHHSSNQYNNDLMLLTLNRLSQQEGYLAEIMLKSRPVKIHHLSQLIQYLDDNDYPYARRECRILFNQVVLNIFQGMEGFA